MSEEVCLLQIEMRKRKGFCEKQPIFKKQVWGLRQIGFTNNIITAEQKQQITDTIYKNYFYIANLFICDTN